MTQMYMWLDPNYDVRVGFVDGKPAWVAWNADHLDGSNERSVRKVNRQTEIECGRSKAESDLNAMGFKVDVQKPRLQSSRDFDEDAYYEYVADIYPKTEYVHKDGSCLGEACPCK